MTTGIARGYGDLDWTALGLIAAEEAGLHDQNASALQASAASNPTPARQEATVS
jgi:hypothetical protein